jgi:hypothetical protein
MASGVFRDKVHALFGMVRMAMQGNARAIVGGRLRFSPKAGYFALQIASLWTARYLLNGDRLKLSQIH